VLSLIILWTPVALYFARKSIVASRPRKPRISRRACSVKRCWCRPIRWLLILTGRVHSKSQKGQRRGFSCLSAMCLLCSWRRKYFFSQPLWVQGHSFGRLLRCSTLCAPSMSGTWRGFVGRTTPPISFRRCWPEKGDTWRIENQASIKEVVIISLDERRTGTLPKSMVSV